MKAKRKRILALALASTATMTHMATAELGAETVPYEKLALACQYVTLGHPPDEREWAENMQAFHDKTRDWRGRPAFQSLFERPDSSVSYLPSSTVSLLETLRLLRSLLLEIRGSSNSGITGSLLGRLEETAKLQSLGRAAARNANDLTLSLDAFTPSARILFREVADFGNAVVNGLNAVLPGVSDADRSNFLGSAQNYAGTFATEGQASLLPNLIAPDRTQHTPAMAAANLVCALSVVSIPLPTWGAIVDATLADELERCGL
jgi:hypothetical protein